MNLDIIKTKLNEHSLGVQKIISVLETVPESSLTFFLSLLSSSHPDKDHLNNVIEILKESVPQNTITQISTHVIEDRKEEPKALDIKTLVLRLITLSGAGVTKEILSDKYMQVTGIETYALAAKQVMSALESLKEDGKVFCCRPKNMIMRGKLWGLTEWFIGEGLSRTLDADWIPSLKAYFLLEKDSKKKLSDYEDKDGHFLKSETA